MNQARRAGSERKEWDESRRYLKLVPFPEILSKIESHLAFYTPRIKSVRVDLALGRISSEDVRSAVDIPNRTVSAMDGYAVRSDDLRLASPTDPRTFTVKGTVYPDHPSKLPFIHSGEAYYVATGAPIPNGADTVVRVEEALPKQDSIAVRRRIPLGKNIAKRGEDIRKKHIVIHKGQVLSPADVALLIGVGRTYTRAYKIPTIGLLSVGNELRQFDPTRRATPAGHITNNYLNLLSGFVQQFGSKAVSLGTCNDDMRAIRDAILMGVKRCDIIFTISGSSVGRRDNVLDALESIPNSTRLFHGVRVVPIRPAGLVIVRGKPVVMMPGHAVSALLTFFVIALPILNIMSGLAPNSRRVIIGSETTDGLSNERAIDALSLVKLKLDKNGKYGAIPLSWGSNLLSNLSLADGFVWLSPHQKILKGQEITVQLFTANGLAKSSWSSSLN